MNIVRTRAPLSLERQKGARTREPRFTGFRFRPSIVRISIDRVFSSLSSSRKISVWIFSYELINQSIDEHEKGGLSDLRGSLEIVEIFRYEREFSYGWIDYWLVDHGRIGNVIVGKVSIVWRSRFARLEKFGWIYIIIRSESVMWWKGSWYRIFDLWASKKIYRSIEFSCDWMYNTLLCSRKIRDRSNFIFPSYFWSLVKNR